MDTPLIPNQDQLLETLKSAQEKVVTAVKDWTSTVEGFVPELPALPFADRIPEPSTIVGHVNVAPTQPIADWPHTLRGMNLFRSEEHARAWPEYDHAAREQTMPLASWVRVFQAPR